MTSQNKISYEIENLTSIDNTELEKELISIIDRQGDKLRILFKDKVFNAVIKNFDLENKSAKINIDGFDFNLKMKEPIDQLINDLGFLTASKHSVKEVKSPMPGLVVSVFVEQGQQVSEGDKLLSLEAMKMENILKSPGDGIVKSIMVDHGSTVDKNQILITFE